MNDTERLEGIRTAYHRANFHLPIAMALTTDPAERAGAELKILNKFFHEIEPFIYLQASNCENKPKEKKQ